MQSMHNTENNLKVTGLILSIIRQDTAFL